MEKTIQAAFVPATATRSQISNLRALLKGKSLCKADIEKDGQVTANGLITMGMAAGLGFDQEGLGFFVNRVLETKSGEGVYDFEGYSVYIKTA